MDNDRRDESLMSDISEEKDDIPSEEDESMIVAYQMYINSLDFTETKKPKSRIRYLFYRT